MTQAFEAFAALIALANIIGAIYGAATHQLSIFAMCLFSGSLLGMLLLVGRSL